MYILIFRLYVREKFDLFFDFYLVGLEKILCKKKNQRGMKSPKKKIAEKNKKKEKKKTHQGRADFLKIMLFTCFKTFFYVLRVNYCSVIFKAFKKLYFKLFFLRFLFLSLVRFFEVSVNIRIIKKTKLLRFNTYAIMYICKK